MPKSAEVTVISAHGLNNVRTYALGWITNDRKSTEKLATHVDTQHGSNPLWNHVMKFPLPKCFRRPKERLVLVITINAQTPCGRYIEIGQASLSLMDFLKSEGYRTCQLPLNGQPNASLSISVKTDVNFSGQRKGKFRTGLKWGFRALNVGVGVVRLMTGDFGGVTHLLPSSFNG